jgi:site-specific DNA recombinase
MATSGDRNGCASRRAKGICDNGQTITRQAIKARVLGGLKDKLFAPELVAEFVHAFQEGANATRRATTHRQAELCRELAGIEHIWRAC